MPSDETPNVVRPGRWNPSSGAGAGGGPPQGPDMSERVGRLERAIEDIKSVLARLEPAIIKIRDDTSELKGKISQIPTIWQLAALIISIFGLAFVLLRYGMPTH